MKKLVIVSLSAGILILGAIAVNADTFQGPPPGCISPEQLGCNLDGVIWNRAITAPQAQNASFYITGNTRTGGTARVGNGLTVDSGGANITGNTNVTGNVNASADINATGYTRAGVNMIEMWPSGDLRMLHNKAIRVDQSGAASALNIGNWGATGDYPVNVNILGTLTVSGKGGWNQAKITSREYCIGTSCITAWPTGGGGGTISSIAAGTGIGVTDGTGPTATVSLDTVYTDGRYVNKTGDTMENTLADSILGVKNNSTSVSSKAITAVDQTGYAIVANTASGVGIQGGAVLGTANGTGVYGVSTYGTGVMGFVNSGQAGLFSNNSKNYHVTLASDYRALAVEGPTRFMNGDVTVYTGSKLCLGGVCHDAWPSGGSGTITGVTAGNGLSGGGTTGSVTLTVGAGTGLAVDSTSVYISAAYRLPTTCAANQVAKWNGSTWVCGTDGPITGITAGNGLSGGGTSGAVTLTVGGGTGIDANATTVDIQQGYRLPQGCALNQVPKWSNTSLTWTCGNDINTDSGGDITGVIANSPLTGGGSSGDVTLNLMFCSLNGQVLKWNGAAWYCAADNVGLTSISAGSGISVSGSTVSMMFCSLNGQVLKWNGAAWYCAADNVGLTSISAGTGISVSGSMVSLNTTYTDGRYVNKAGDTMTGNLSFGSATRQMINLFSTSYAIGVQSSTLYNRSNGNFAWFKAGIHSDVAYDPGTGGTTQMYLSSSGELHLPNSGAGYYFSDRAAPNSRWFAWYANSGSAYLWHNINGNRLRFSDTGLAYKPGGGSWADLSSDARTKKNIENYTNGLNLITKLQPVTYEFNGLGETTEDGKTYVGLIAQSIPPEARFMVLDRKAKLHPDDEQESDLLTVDITEVHYALINSIKELKSQNDELRAQNQDLEKRLQRLEALMSTILR
jgi:hypothetical protein